jgi:cell shape-determining protein MreC
MEQAPDMAIKILYILGGVLGGGVGVAIVKGWFNLRLKSMDQYEQERKDILDQFHKLEKKFDELYAAYYEQVKKYNKLEVEYEHQKKEIDRLNKKVQDLSQYKSQTHKLAKLQKALSDYYKHHYKDQVIEEFEKQILK